MNLELLARLNQEYLQQLHRDARRDSLARAALRLPATATSFFASWKRLVDVPTASGCCQAVS